MTFFSQLQGGLTLAAYKTTPTSNQAAQVLLSHAGKIDAAALHRSGATVGKLLAIDQILEPARA